MTMDELASELQAGVRDLYEFDVTGVDNPDPLPIFRFTNGSADILVMITPAGDGILEATVYPAWAQVVDEPTRVTVTPF